MQELSGEGLTQVVLFWEGGVLGVVHCNSQWVGRQAAEPAGPAGWQREKCSAGALRQG
jgi:hypothetical protein